MTLLDGQYRFDAPTGVSLTIGAGTPYRVITVSGLRALGPISAADTKRTGQKGTLRAGRRTYGLRVIQLDIVADATDQYDRSIYPGDVEELVDMFYACFQNHDKEGDFVLKRRNKEERVVHGSVRLAEFGGDYSSWVGYANGSVQLACSDPLVYATRTDVSTFVPKVSGGRPYPRVYPVIYSGSVGGTPVPIVNRGSEKSPPRWQVVGPWTSPGLFNLTTGQQVKIDVDLGVGDTIDVDFDSHSILLNGVSRRGFLDVASDWWDLVPGENDVVALGDGTGISSLTYQSAWPSA